MNDAPWMRETGAIRPKADVELKMAAGILNASANMPTEAQGLLLPSNQGRISLARRLPHGVVGVIAPFNFPLILAIRAVSPALATGNTVVLKPDPQTAAAGGALIARLFEEAGLPEGALHVLPGGAEVGQAICTDSNIAMVAFTGSTAAGRRVGELCGKHLKKVSLELGGKNSLIVLDDADPGAKLSAGGTFDKLFYKPTVIDNVKPGMRAFEEEIFGPVASVTSFSTDDEAIRLANQTEYGLSAAVISRSIGRAMAIGNRLYTGLLHINDQTVHDEPHIPFGGRGASGNGGRIGGPANWEEFTQWQWVTIKDSPPRYPF
ncbi:MAG TPA: aldehyde dehydrogenase family protein [Steroidobacteraceae bacterium]|nr:aldehyde dehydrogenase family protein [Steroidobacteraceae bacterium]